MKNTIKELEKLEPGFLPKEVFEAIARLVVTPTFVVIPFLKDEDGIKVCLKRRGSEVSGDAGMLHPTGTVILATDQTLDDTYQRLIKEELFDVKLTSEPIFCEIVFAEIARGKEISLLHYVEIDSTHTKDLYDPENLPDDVPKSDIPRIQSAYRKFQTDQQKC